MKRAVFLLLCLCMAVVFSACGQQGTTGQPEPAEDRPAQQNANPPVSQSAAAQPEATPAAQPEAEGSEKAPKVSVNLPAGWEPVETNLPAHYIKNDSAVFMVMEQGYVGDTLDAVVEIAKAANETMYSNVKYDGETTVISVDGIEARRFVCSYEFAGLSMKSMFVYLFYGQDVYAIVFSDFAESYDLLSEDYDAILAQINFE